MKKSAVFLVVLAVFLVAGSLALADEPVFTAAEGESVYVCACGPDCACNTLSSRAGSCSCGSPLVEGKVVSGGDGTVRVAIGDREQEFKTAGKYACACGPGCTCNTVSQSPGNCSCGSPLKKVE